MASYYAPRYITTENAAVDLSSSQFLYVAENGSNLINIAGGTNGAKGLGFLMNNPEAGEACEIASLGGGAKGVAAETITVAAGNITELKADALGKMRNAIPGDIVSALAIESAAVDDVFEVMPVYYVKAAAPVVFQAAADLTSGQYLYVGDSSGDINVVGGATGAAGYGFLMNAPDTGEEAVINGPGMPFTKGISGAAFLIGAELKANALGKLETALEGDYVVAIAQEAATAADETIDIMPVLYVKPSATITFASAADLTTKQYYYVGDSGGDVDVVGGAAGAIGYGFLQNAPGTGEDAIINGPGYSATKAISGAATTIMAELMSDATGRLIDTTGAGDIVCALGLEATSGVGETFTVIPVLYRKHA